MHNSRQNQILEYLKLKKSARVTEMADHFNVTNMTIRRDLTLLEKNGLVKRSHGGAVPVVNNNVEETNFSTRSIKNLRQKQAISQKAVSLISDHTSIYIDGSTTCSELVKLLPNNMRLTVFTDSVAALIELRDRHEQISIFLIGGELAADNNTLDGYIAVNIIQKICVDMCFISCAGFTAEGITNAGLIGTSVKKIILKNSKRRILLADSSKYDSRYLYMLSRWQDIDILISDSGLDGTAREKLEQQNINILIADDEE